MLIANVSTTDERRDTLRRTIRNRVPFVSTKVPDLLTRLKIPREGGHGITRSDLFVINKIDLAPFVRAGVGAMEADTLSLRGKRAFVFLNLKSGEGVEPIANFIIETGRLGKERCLALWFVTWGFGV